MGTVLLFQEPALQVLGARLVHLLQLLQGVGTPTPHRLIHKPLITATFALSRSVCAPQLVVVQLLWLPSSGLLQGPPICGHLCAPQLAGAMAGIGCAF